MNERRVNFRLYLITDRKQAAAHGGGLLAVVAAALSAAATTASPGAIAVQLREKDLPARDLYDLARTLLPLCQRHSAPLLINDRTDVVLAAGASGVHLPSDGMPLADARRLLGPSRLIGISAHSPGEVASAAIGGADFAVYGPVHDPLSKAANGAARGAEGLAAACRAAAMPVYALGGMTAERIHRLRTSAAFGEGRRPAGAGVIGAVFGADHPRAATLALLDALKDWS